MNKKLLAVSMLMTLAMVSSVYATDFIIESNGGSTLFNLTSAGFLNITTGKIAEQGTLLENIYCAQTGCTYTGTVEAPTVKATTLLNASGATLDFDDDAVEESDISFTTTCGSGNRLYISGGDLACEAVAAVADTHWDISTSNYLINNSDILDLDETKLNATIDARAVTSESDPVWTAASGNYNTKAEDITKFVNRSDWTTIDNYPTACTAGQAVQAVGDTLTCVDISSEVTDVWVNTTGDTMTGNLVMDNADVSLTNGAKVVGEGSNSMDLQANGNIVFTLGP